MDGERNRYVKELAFYGIALKTATADECIWSSFMGPRGPMMQQRGVVRGELICRNPHWDIEARYSPKVPEGKV